MEWVERMNRAMDYLEAHLAGDWEPEEIARIMACPYAVFQRSFAPITGVRLSEYLLRRRLSQAALDLRNTQMRVIDVALRYGYDSADAFAAAFKRLHGITPQAARLPGANLTFYSRITFTLSITGVQEMTYRVLERETFDVLGIRRVTPFGGGTWGVIKQDGSIRQIERTCGACDLGLCFGFAPDGSNDYLCGGEYAGPDVAGLDRYTYPACAFLVFTAQGSIAQNVLGRTWQRIYGEFMPQSEYRQKDLPTIERYVLWDEAGDDCLVEILIPVEK